MLLALIAAPGLAVELGTVPSGRFEMGKTIDYGYGEMDGPTHTVTLSRPFAVAKHEVTLGEFRAFTIASGYTSAGKCNVYREGRRGWFIDPERNWESPGFPQEESHPVVCVSWEDTQVYIKWLNDTKHGHYRLPSEAEWEYLASDGALGGAQGVTHDVANIGKEICCGGETGSKDVFVYTAPVGSFPADKFGLHDVRGNVWEWQADCYHKNYDSAPVDGGSRQSCPIPGFRVVRGGSYGDAARFLNERFRLSGTETQGYFTVGFRLAQDLP